MRYRRAGSAKSACFVRGGADRNVSHAWEILSYLTNFASILLHPADAWNISFLRGNILLLVYLNARPLVEMETLPPSGLINLTRLKKGEGNNGWDWGGQLGSCPNCRPTQNSHTRSPPKAQSELQHRSREETYWLDDGGPHIGLILAMIGL